MVSDDWENYCLNEIISLIGGGTPKTTNPEYWNGDIPWLSVVDFNNDFRYVYSTEKTITKKGLEESSTKLLKKGQLIISARGTVGCLAQLTKDMAFNQSCYGITAVEGKTTNDYLYYLLRYYVGDLRQITHGAVFDTITRDTFKHIHLKIPPLPEQKAIARILGSLDDKIELNNRMNKTLEEMAQALFKSWFVDFDPVRAKAEGRQPEGMDEETAVLFPNEFEIVDGREIPKEWKVDEIRSITSNIQYGLTQSASFDPIGPKFLRITDIRGRNLNWGNVPYCKVTEEEYQKYKIENGDIFVARTGASTGDNIYIIDPPESVFASYLVRFRFSSPEISRIVGEFMGTETYIDFVKSSIGGSAQPNASAQLLASVKLIVPPKNIAKSFFDLISNFDILKAKNQRESQTLAEIRDALLPKLISGEIRVPDK